MPRRYNRDRRDEAVAATRRRIVKAIVDLHAEQGAQNTSYAMIAARADVAVPTVYKHFPNLTEMFNACVGHVTAQAPPLGPEIFTGLSDAASRLDALVRAIAARYRFLTPWLRWTMYEAPLIPELAVHHRRALEQRKQLIATALTPAFESEPLPALVGLIDALLDFRTWHALTEEHHLTDADAATMLSDAVRLLLERHARAAPGLPPARPHSPAAKGNLP